MWLNLGESNGWNFLTNFSRSMMWFTLPKRANGSYLDCGAHKVQKCGSNGLKDKEKTTKNV